MISIVIPVYNCEAYLEQCLRSVQAQHRRDWEVLLVNDGSIDGSAAICDRFAAADDRIRVIHQPNGGVSSARNLALERARGTYLTFIDADDYVEPDFLEALRVPMETHEVAVCGYDRVRPDASQDFVLAGTGSLPMERLYEHTLCTQLIGGGCCNKMFRLDIIRSQGLRFDTRIAVGEDMLFLMQYFQRCQRAFNVARVLYHYRFNEVSATEAGFAQKKVNERTASILLAVAAMTRHVDPARPYQQHFVGFRQARSSLRLFFQMVLSRTQEPALLAAIQRNIRQGLWPFLQSRHSRWLEKAVVMGVALSSRGTYAGAVALSGLLSRHLHAYRT